MEKNIFIYFLFLSFILLLEQKGRLGRDCYYYPEKKNDFKISAALQHSSVILLYFFSISSPLCSWILGLCQYVIRLIFQVDWNETCWISE